MQYEPTEINLMKSSARTRISPRRSEQPVEILDAAFDDYRRVDVATSIDSSRNKSAGMTKALIADITAQLDILDRQREQLANLLKDVNL
jgi:hypothetical protein